MAVRFEQAICFASVVEAGSFTAAAGRLQRSKAHLSKQVSALEAALGVQLLLRSTRRLKLTDAGRTYLEYCQQLRDTLAESERAVSAQQQSASGTLRLSAPTSMGAGLVLDLLLAFQARHPEVRIALDLSIQHRDLVGEGLDFAIRTSRTLDETLVAQPLGLIDNVAVASPAFLAGQPAIVQPSDLRLTPCLLNSHLQDDQDWVFHRHGASTLVTVSGVFSANHFATLLAAALRGAGVARLPRFLVAEALANGQLVRVLPEFDLMPTPIYLVYPQRRFLPVRQRLFREFVVDWFGKAEQLTVLRQPSG